jgi:hypothetical protein
MSVSPFSRRFSHWRLAAALAACVTLGGWLIAPDGHSQAPAPVSAEAFGALISQIKTQQDQMAVNQTKIETQTAALKEEMRLLKIYSARGGSSSRR